MNSKPGFGLLEVIIAIAILGLAMAVVIPNFRGRQPKYEREQFIARLNGLAQFARKSAIMTTKIHKVAFDFSKREAWIEAATGQKSKEGEAEFAPIKSSSTRARISWPEQFSFKNFYIEGFDEMSRFSGRATQEVWFFVMPEGLAQEVIANVVDTKDRIDKKPRQIGLVLNPFNAQFKIYDAFQKP
jgi:prepilin-type N-terminal cleavage/methylation domain-containing protein